MKKLSTLFKKDPTDLGRVINEVNPENEWVFTDGIPTRKFDGTSCAIIKGELYKRYDAKKNRKTGKYKLIPLGAIPCQEPDEITGHYPHWIKCDKDNPADKWHIEALFNRDTFRDTTYELCGEKIQGNPENIQGHKLIMHGSEILDIVHFNYVAIKSYLSNPNNNIEGIVFHHKTDDRMCKIRKSDFGIQR